MKRFLLICAVVITIYACKKEAAAPVYDTHLFAQLQSHNWIFDSSKITDSASRDTTVYAPDTAMQITQFASGLYIIRTVRDTAILDSTVYDAIYDNPDKIYYYTDGGQVNVNQYLTIDTVNGQRLILNGTDTLRNTSASYYHAQ